MQNFSALIPWQNCIKQFDLTSTCEFFSYKNYLAKCTLVSPDYHTSVGYGRGSQCEIPAKYEALEHFITINIKNFISYKIFPLTKIAKGIQIKSEFLPQAFYFSEKNKSQALAWTDFTDLFSAKIFWVPICGINPHYSLNPFNDDPFNYENIYLSGTDNGTSVNSTLEDSLIKSICELLERDSWSLLLGNLIFKKNVTALQILNQNSLPDDFQKLFTNVQNDTHASLTIFKIPNEFGLYCYGATLTTADMIFAAKGFAIDFNELDAIYNAALEAYQQFYIYKNESFADELFLYEFYKNYPELQACIKFDIPHLQKELGIATFDLVLNQDTNLAKEEKINFLKKIIKRKKIDILYKIFYQHEDIVSVQAISPQLENFFTLSYGTISPPRKRLKQILAKQI